MGEGSHSGSGTLLSVYTPAYVDHKVLGVGDHGAHRQTSPVPELVDGELGDIHRVEIQGADGPVHHPAGVMFPVAMVWRVEAIQMTVVALLTCSRMASCPA